MAKMKFTNQPKLKAKPGDDVYYLNAGKVLFRKVLRVQYESGIDDDGRGYTKELYTVDGRGRALPPDAIWLTKEEATIALTKGMFEEAGDPEEVG